MIAKDEEAWIAQCIQSVLPIVQEVILVDTGSTDSTIRIAQELGARVFERPWDDDFAAPRNLSIEKASSDWILVLDADETFAARDLAQIQRLTLDRSKCYEFTQRHYSNDVRISAFKPVRGEYPEWERHYGGYFESKLCRLFPHHEGLNYQGRVHELVEHSIQQRGKHAIVYSPIPIHHYGHTEEVRAKKKKGSLYTPLGTQKLSDEPTSWKAWFELGVEHNNNGKLEESVQAFTRSLELNAQYLDTWVNIGYVLCEQGRFDEALMALRNAVKLNPRSHEAYCNLGVVHLRQSQLPAAEQCFRIAIKLVPHYVNAYCNLGKALALQRRIAEAAQIYFRALDLLPQNATAHLDLAVLYFQSGVPGEAQKHLNAVLHANPQHATAYYLLAQVLRQLNERDKAAQALTTYIELVPTQMREDDAARNVAQARRELEGLASGAR